MKKISKVFLTGLATILPSALTIYILYWLGSAAETRLGALIKFVIPEEFYWTGMGLLAGVALVFSVGLLMKAYIVRKLVVFGEELLARVPLVKSLYGSIRDLMKFVAGSKDKQLGQVVSVKIAEPDLWVLGFLTNEHVAALDSSLREDFVAVYLPLSYQIGGHTVLVPRSSVRPSAMSAKDAMRFAITAGMITGETNHTRGTPE
jgi:uncharacterized membrane protein